MQYQIETIAQPLRFHSRQGQLVTARLATMVDTFLVADLIGRLSVRTRQLRYMSLRHFSADETWREAVRMTQSDPQEHLTLVATTRRNQFEQAIAVAELVRDQYDGASAEIALVVHDDAQRQGIGGFLLAWLARLAYRSGITTLNASMLAENKAMLGLIAALELPYTAKTSYGETQVLVSIPRRHTESGLAQSTRKLAA